MAGVFSELIWERSARKSGRPLSRAAEEPACREFHDDLAGAEKDAALDGLRARSHRESVCIHSEDPRLGRHAHFVRGADGAVRTSLSPA